MSFIDHMLFVCFSAAIVNIILLIIGGMFELINYLSEGKFKTWIVDIFSE